MLYRRLVIVFALTFGVLGFIGMQLATPFWAEIGQRIAELYFLFFVTSWVYSRPRSRRYYILAFVIVMAVISVLDVLGWDPSGVSLKLYSWLIPGIYCVIFLLLPAFFGKLVEPEQVPERVTFK